VSTENLEEGEELLKPTRDTMVSYDAVLEALVLTASGDDAKGEEEKKAKREQETIFKLHTLSITELEKQAERLQTQVNIIEDELITS